MRMRASLFWCMGREYGFASAPRVQLGLSTTKLVNSPLEACTEPSAAPAEGGGIINCSHARLGLGKTGNCLNLCIFNIVEASSAFSCMRGGGYVDDLRRTPFHPRSPATHHSSSRLIPLEKEHMVTADSSLSHPSTNSSQPNRNRASASPSLPFPSLLPSLTASSSPSSKPQATPPTPPSPATSQSPRSPPRASPGAPSARRRRSPRSGSRSGAAAPRSAAT